MIIGHNVQYKPTWTCIYFVSFSFLKFYFLFPHLHNLRLLTFLALCPYQLITTYKCRYNIYSMGFNDKARRHYGRPPRVFIVLCTGLALGLAVAHFSVRPKSRANVQCPPCPACPACICQQPEKIAVGHASQRKAREQEALFAAIDKYFGYESPFVDYGKVGNHTTNFQLLSSTVFPVARPDVLELWRSLQPYTQHYKHGGNNGMFGECDGAVLYAMVRKLQPARIYEVGSGFSTQVAHAALKDVAAETGKMGKHLCIEPYRAAVVRDTLGSQVHIIQQPIQEVALSLFDDLQAGDLLFLDNAHIIR